MPDFAQSGPITTIHDLGMMNARQLEDVVTESTAGYKIGLVLPLTASDMRAPPFARIIDKLAGVPFIDTIVIVLNRAPASEDYRDCLAMVSKLGDKAQILWTDGPRGP